MRALAVLLCLTPAFASVQLLPNLPLPTVARAIQLDASGNIYIAGSFTPGNPKDSQDTSDAFVAKLSPDGATVLYLTTLSGSFSDDANAIALGPDGSAYVAGSTGSSDFPTTSGAYQTTFDFRGASQGFLVKLNPAGTVVYSSFINGPAFTQVTNIALDPAGEVLVTGSGGPAYPVNSNQPTQGFLLKFDPTLTKPILSEYGYGGGPLTLDSQGNIYIAGSAQPNVNGSTYMLPPFPAGAFQTTGTAVFCSSASGGPSPGFSSFCRYQYVAKLDTTGKLLWGTYVTGTFGAIAGGIAIDGAGNVIVAGTTNSDDYPVTRGAFQTTYTAGALRPPLPPGFTQPPNATGYVTKVNATGTALIWSTYFGGSFQDQITGIAIAPTGDILLSGRAGSDDLFFGGTPQGCRPTANQVLGFVGRLSADGTSAASTIPITDAPDCTYLGCSGLQNFQTGWPVALRKDGTALVAGSNGAVAVVNFAATSRLSCLIDPADNVQIETVSPGQLVSVFGLDLAFPATSGSVPVLFNGIAAPILYSSTQQINAQVPFEIAGSATVQMQLGSETRTLGVVDRQPSLYLAPSAFQSSVPGSSVCGGTIVFGQAALALNSDGTVNDCTNPAAPGTPVTVFLNGFGQVTPALATGAIATSPATALMPSLDPGLFTGTTTIATTTDPGSISGVAQVRLLPGTPSALLNLPSFGGTPLRERLIIIWTR